MRVPIRKRWWLCNTWIFPYQNRSSQIHCVYTRTPRDDSAKHDLTYQLNFCSLFRVRFFMCQMFHVSCFRDIDLRNCMKHMTSYIWCTGRTNSSMSHMKHMLKLGNFSFQNICFPDNLYTVLLELFCQPINVTLILPSSSSRWHCIIFVLSTTHPPIQTSSDRVGISYS